MCFQLGVMHAPVIVEVMDDHFVRHALPFPEHFRKINGIIGTRFSGKRLIHALHLPPNHTRRCSIRHYI
jgi:hypothetical protein